MDHLPVNPECEFSGTKYCHLLNMGSCEKCTIRTAEDQAEIAKDLDLYETLLPANGVRMLFTEKECQLCRGEQKGKRSGYAILDMAHPEPKRTQRWLLGKRTLRIGTMIPVQLSVCKKCRRTILVIDYLPAICAVFVGFPGLFVCGSGALADQMKNVSPVLPFAVWIGIVVLSVLLGKLLAALITKRANRRMYVDVLDHPVLSEMLDKGWTPINFTGKHAKVLFSRSRIARGLGTASTEFEPETKERTWESVVASMQNGQND